MKEAGGGGFSLRLHNLAESLPTDLGVFDAVLCDPPYHLARGKRGGVGFMGEAWDSGDVAFRSETWTKVLGALRPGAPLLAFGGSRTYHRLACAIEDAGAEIRDNILATVWLHGQGYPKSLDISKAIDRAAGAERRVTEEPATADSRSWDGYGTALKPAWEPVVFARKPLSGTVVQNALKHGVGGLNVDGARIGWPGEPPVIGTPGWGGPNKTLSAAPLRDGVTVGRTPPSDLGRWPANVVLSHHPECREVGSRAVRSDGHHPATRGSGGISTSGHGGQQGLEERRSGTEIVMAWDCHQDCPVRALDQSRGAPKRGENHGGPSRFYYCAKVSPRERAGCAHPTLKPLDLCRHLATLILPPPRADGAARRLLVPFAGAGSEIAGALLAGWDEVVGLELEERWVLAAEARILRLVEGGGFPPLDNQPLGVM